MGDLLLFILLVFDTFLEIRFCLTANAKKKLSNLCNVQCDRKISEGIKIE